jgi:hypothetical protein
MNTHDDILTLLIISMEQAIEFKKNFEPDKPIRDQFDDQFDDVFDDVFDEYMFIVGTFNFELEADYEIPEDLEDYSLTFREFAEEIAKHPKEPYDYRKHWQN